MRRMVQSIRLFLLIVSEKIGKIIQVATLIKKGAFGRQATYPEVPETESSESTSREIHLHRVLGRHKLL